MVDEANSVQTQEAAALSEVSRLLQKGSAKLSGPDGEQVAFPARLYKLLKDAVQLIEDGKCPVISTEDQELTTERAAELLGMAQRYMIWEIEEGRIPHRMVGEERRVSFRDVLAYAKRQTEMRAALAAITRDAVEAGLYENHIGLLEGQSDE